MSSRRARRLSSRVLVTLAVLAVWPLMTTVQSRGVEQSVRTAVVEAVDSIALSVGDMDRSVAFFSDVLDFQKLSDVELTADAYEKLFGVPGARIRVVAMRLGDERIELHQFLTPRGRPMPADSRANDRWFQHIAIITRDMEVAYAHLRNRQVEPASAGPQTLPAWNKCAAGIRAYYFRDPDGHFLEILQFPSDKGDAKWHRPTERLFLGIDHTAIVVADTDAALAFYRNTLGLRVAGTSENYGVEQERLNKVSGARLRITTLRAAHGPGIELLEYLTPVGGRPAPSDTRPNDLWHWHVRLRTGDTAGLDAFASRSIVNRASTCAVRLPEKKVRAPRLRWRGRKGQLPPLG